MRKKEIEKIPYLTLPNTSKKKEVMYIGVTAIRNIGNKRHIILEIYRNDKKCLKVPVVRYVASKDDFGEFFTEKGIWRTQSIEKNDYGDYLCWQKTGEYGRDYHTMPKANILHDENDLSRIEKFFNKESIWNKSRWWRYFGLNENEIRIKKERKARDNRDKRLDDRIKATPELDEEAILDWAEMNIFHNKHYLYYKKRGRYADVACTKCGGVASGAWKSGQSYESMFEKTIIEPRNGHIGYCPICGATGTYKPSGNAKGSYEMQSYIFAADKYKKNGAVIRYIQVNKEFQLEFIAGEKEPEMHGAYEALSGVEIARTYYEEGKKPQTDFHKHSGYSGKDFWDDCNLYGMSNIRIGEAVLLKGFEENLKGTILQYCQIGKFIEQAEKREINAFTYMTRYVNTPQWEMLVKLGLTDVVKKLLRCEYGIVNKENADRVDEYLGIRKDRVKLLISSGGNIPVLNVLKMEKREGQTWTEEQIYSLAEIQADYSVIDLANTYMSIQKILNIIKKYAGCEYGTECSHASERLRSTASMYFDYMSMRRQLGYDLNNTVYQRPRNLRIAHDKMVEESNKKKADERIRQVEDRYVMIRKNYRKLRNRYFYSDDTYEIRPARSATEIVMEGRILHHCVGGDTYLEKHNNGVTTILFLRFKNGKETPYITVEIQENKIIQWYGAHDKKPDEKNIKRWLDAYTNRLMCEKQEKTNLSKIQIVAAVG